jgi:hypothetical protein
MRAAVFLIPLLFQWVVGRDRGLGLGTRADQMAAVI